MKRMTAMLLAVLLGVSAPMSTVHAKSGKAGSDYSFTAGDLTVKLNDKGVVTGLLDEEGKDYATKDPDPVAPLIKLVVAPEEGEMSGKDGTEVLPSGLKVDGEVMTFSFENGVEVDVTQTKEEKYTKLEVTRLDKNGVDVELMMWGPIMTTIKENFGETLGVVYDKEFAIGYRGLNDKTQMNAPHEYVGEKYNGSEHLNVAYPQDRSRFEGRVWDLKMSAAVPTTFGSYLMGFTYDATTERVRWAQYGASGMQRVPALEDEKEASIVGSEIALYGRAKGKEKSIKDAVLDTVSTMELAEGLPHPLCIDGKWQKESPLANQPYFIIDDINSKDVDRMDKASDYAVKAGYKFVYKNTFFTSGGDGGSYVFNGGDEAMKKVVDAARKKGIYVGTHTLSAFINDEYANGTKGTLAGSRSAFLVEDAKAGSTTIHVTADYVSGKDYQLGSNRFGVSKAEKQADGTYVLTLNKALTADCAKDEALYTLAVNQYGSRVAGSGQTYEVAGNLARALTNTGMMQMSFDGAEGGWATGLANYDVNRMMNGMYYQLGEEQQKYLISDSSGGFPNAWHVSTRENWGEPWGLGMRNSMMEYRYNNQVYYDRNFIPRMLGWFQYLNGQPTIDMEWMLAKSAGFDAGYALNTSLSTLDGNGNTPDVLNAFNEWEKARQAKAFTKDQQERMLDKTLDWHLEPVEGKDNQWKLYCIDYQADPITHTYNGKAMKYREFNPWHAQPLYLELQAKNGAVESPVVSNGEKTFTIKGTVPQNYYVVYDGGKEATLYDSRWNEKGTLPVEGEVFDLPQGVTNITIDFGAANNSVVLSARVQTESYAEDVYAGNKAKGPAEYPMEDAGEDGGNTGDETRDNLLLNREVKAYNFDTKEELDLAYLASVTDGETARTDTTFGGRYGQKQYLQMDLGSERNIDTIRYFGDDTGNYPGYTNTPFNVVIAISTTEDFAEGTYKVIYNTDKDNMWGFGNGEDPVEVNKPEPKVFKFEATPARYVRYYQYGAEQTGASNMGTWMSLRELEAYGQLADNDVAKVLVNDVQTSVGVKPVLPEEAIVEYGDGHRENKAVTWDEITEEQYSEAGQFTVVGTMEGVGSPAECKVVVRNTPVITLDVPAAVFEKGSDVTVGLGAVGASNVTEMSLRVYWDKSRLSFDDSADKVDVKIPGVEIVNYNVNNESALIDMDLKSEKPLTAEELVHILDLKFGVVATGSAVVETKVASFTDAENNTVDAENHKAKIEVLPEEVVEESYKVTVVGGEGSGEYKAGAEVTVSAVVPEGKEFTGWVAEGLELAEEEVAAEIITFNMPANDVTLTAQFKDKEEEVQPADKTNLEAAIKAAEEVDRSQYTEESVAALDEALANAKAVMDDESLTIADQQKVDYATKALEDAMEGLVKAADKSLLQATYDYALTLSTDGVVDSAVKFFEEAKAEAKAVLDNPDATQEEVNAVWNKLLNSIFGLGIVQGDKTNLKLLIDRAEAMMAEQDRYVQKNWKQLVDALEAAKVVMEDGDALEEDVQKAAGDLLNAILVQRYKANKDNLQNIIDRAEELDLSKYTKESVAVFKKALKEAKAVMANENLSVDDQKTVDKSVKDLADAIDGLKLASGDGNDNNGGNDNNNGSNNNENNNDKKDDGTVQTGDASNVALWLFVAVGALAVVVKRRRAMR